MSIEGSAIPRHALTALLARAERAAAEGDDAVAKALLSDLHWFAHDDGELHHAVHRLELALARRRGDLRGAVAQVLPVLFARPVSFFESFAPDYEVVRTIAAPPETIYRVMADVGAYSEWNPWISAGEGRATQVGDEVDVTVRLDRDMKVRHRVIVASPSERFGWCDLGWFTPLASGRRLRWLEPAADGVSETRVVTRIKLYGPLAHLAWAMHGAAIRRGMEAEADRLGDRAAALHAGAARSDTAAA